MTEALSAQDRRAMRVLCCLVAAQGGAVTLDYLKAAAGMATRFVHQAIHDLRTHGFCVVRCEGVGWQLWEPAE